MKIKEKKEIPKFRRLKTYLIIEEKNSKNSKIIAIKIITKWQLREL